MKTRTSLPTVTILSIIVTVFFFSCKKENQDEGAFTDTRDGNTYSTVKLGNQIWMAENLAYLPEVSPSSLGAVNNNDYADPFYYVYGYEGSDVGQAKSNVNYGKYGVLYNWQAAIDACPAGWHLPTDADWKELEMFLGMSQSDTEAPIRVVKLPAPPHYGKTDFLKPTVILAQVVLPLFRQDFAAISSTSQVLAAIPHGGAQQNMIPELPGAGNLISIIQT